MKTLITAITSLCFSFATIAVAENETKAFPQGANSTRNAAVANYYDTWKNTYLRTSKTVSGGYYIRMKDSDSPKSTRTTSEAIGYGMWITVLMAGHDSDAHTIFDGINAFRKAHYSIINGKLMDWEVADSASYDPASSSDDDSATDGDLDQAYALLLASEQWSDSTYRDEALKIIDALQASCVRAGFSKASEYSLAMGDWDGGSMNGNFKGAKGKHKDTVGTRLSDAMPSHFSAFSRAGRPFWDKVATTEYRIMNETISPAGAFPDFVTLPDSGSQRWKSVVMTGKNTYLEDKKYDGSYWYNSCRVPWRLTLAATLDNDTKAIALLAKFHNGIGGITWDKFTAGYQMDGKPINTWTDASFNAPHMCSLLVNKNSDWEKAFDRLKGDHSNGYFGDTLNLLSLLLVTENCWTP